MAKSQKKLNDEIIFKKPKPKINIEAEALDALQVKKLYGNAEIAESVKQAVSTVTETPPILKLDTTTNASMNDIEVEEIICKLANEISNNLEFVKNLSDTIADRLVQQLDSSQAFTFIRQNSSIPIDTDFIAFKQDVLAYGTVLRELLNVNITKCVTMILNKKIGSTSNA